MTDERSSRREISALAEIGVGGGEVA